MVELGNGVTSSLLNLSSKRFFTTVGLKDLENYDKDDVPGK